MSQAAERTAFDVAEDLLRNGSSEVDWRASISRAYFAARGHILDQPDAAKFVSHGTADDHGRLIRYLRDSGDPKLIRVASNLRKLRHARNQADYDPSERVTKSSADEALERSAEIIFDLMPGA